MSQIKYTHGSHQVLVGWDRPLQYYFLVVRSAKTGLITFSNLDLPEPGMSLRDIERVLRNFFLPFPDLVRERMIQHQESNAGNLVCRFDVERNIWIEGDYL